MARLTPPKDLDPLAKSAWRNLVRQHDHLTDADSAMLRNYSVAVAIAQKAEELLSRDGLIVETVRGVGRHPASSVLHEASSRITRCLRELKCTPSTRRAKTHETESTPLNAPIRFTVTG